MISVSGVYTLVRRVVAELTHIEVYQVKGRSNKEVEAKWLFANTVYTLFYKTNVLENLTKPYLYEISYQLGYNCNDSITYLMRYYKPSEELKELGEQLTKFCISKIKQIKKE